METEKQYDTMQISRNQASESVSNVNNKIATPPPSDNSVNSGPVPDVYVDGACRENGKSAAKGGCGVFWGDYHPMNSSEQLYGDKQTNNRAELSAAIIGIKQAKVIKLVSINIHTDSKYVKEGITKWMMTWETNGWKTTTGKDVLNKDLWLTLKSVQSGIQVNWHWVQGHTESEGNIKADELAKNGISAKQTYWQIDGRDLRVENDQQPSTTKETTELKTVVDSIDNRIDQIKPVTIPVARKMTTRGDTKQQIEKKCAESEKKSQEYTPSKCPFCKQIPKDKEPCIECSDCKSWCHYKCTKLPDYQLHVFEQLHRKYSCLDCSGFDQSDTGVRTKDSAVQTELIKSSTILTQTDKASYSSSTTQTEVNLTEDKNSLKAGKHEKAETSTESSKMQEDKNFMQASLNMMERAFVSAVEKITTRDIEQQSMKSELIHLRDTNNKLMKSIEKKDSTIQELEKKCKIEQCKECKGLTTNIQKLKAENTKLAQSKHELYLEKEIQSSRLSNDISLLKMKADCCQRNIDMLNEELKLRDTREKTKNDIILELESSLKDQACVLLQLHDEYISLKLHESRESDLLTRDYGEDKHKEKNTYTDKKTLTPRNTVKRNETDSKTNEEVMNRGDSMKEEKKRDQKKEIQKTDEHKKETHEKENEINEHRNHETTRNRTTNVAMIGTSNIRFVSQKYMEEDEFQLEKVTKYTQKETIKYIKESDSKDAYILHTLCNEMANRPEDDCVDEVKEMVNVVKEKNDKAKVVLSLGLPRNNTKLNRKIERINNSIKESFAEDNNVEVCDNSNLFYRGNASRGVLENDGLHLARTGTSVFSKNLKASLMKVLKLKSTKKHNYQQHAQPYYEQQQQLRRFSDNRGRYSGRY